MEWIAVLLALGAGFLAGWKLAAQKIAELSERKTAAETENTFLREACEKNIASEREHARQQMAEQEKIMAALREDCRKSIDAEKENSRRQMAEQEKVMAAKFDLMKAEFRTLSEQIFTEKNAAMQENNKQQIGNLLAPLREKMTEFKKSVDDAKDKGIEQSARLSEQIKKMLEETHNLGSEAAALTSALRGEQKTQGCWGEMILEDILVRSGLQRDIHYEVQATIKDDDGRTIKSEENKMLRPDVIVHYPDGKDIIIDSKVSLTAYTDYMNSSDAESAGDALRRHHKSIAAHVDELAKKNYAGYLKKSDRETIDFVIMFIPNEASYLLALKNNPLLWQEAFARKVVIVSPLHLMTLLRLIHISWTKSEQDRNQLEILKNAGQMLDRLYAFYADFDEIGQRMEKLQESYGNALKRLKQTPNGHSIVSTGEKLKKLGVKLSKERSLPSRLEVESEVFPLPGIENSSDTQQKTKD